MIIIEYIVSMGLSITLAVYVAFRAGRSLRNLTDENMEERLSDFAFDCVKERISTKLNEILIENGVPLPGGVTIQQVADHLHGDIENFPILENIYHSLLELGIMSPYYIQAVQYIQHL